MEMEFIINVTVLFSLRMLKQNLTTNINYTIIPKEKEKNATENKEKNTTLYNRLLCSYTIW